MGHEYAGTVVETGSGVRNVKPGDFVVGSFFTSDNSCEICQAGYQSRCTLPVGHVGYVGVSHGVQLPGEDLFYAEVHLLGGPAPVRRPCPISSG